MFSSLPLVRQYGVSEINSEAVRPSGSITWENFSLSFLFMCVSFVVLIFKSVSHHGPCSAVGPSLHLPYFHVKLSLPSFQVESESHQRSPCVITAKSKNYLP